MVNKEKIISFPRMANYHIPIEILIKNFLPSYKIQAAPPITKKTLELGSRYSPDFVCTPFKYNLGNYIEALEQGANVLIQAGGGCRYGFYGEVQEEILKDLGYDFTFINLMNVGINILSIYKLCRSLGSKLSVGKMIYFSLLVIKMIKIIDKLEFYIRENIGFEVEENSFQNMKNKFFQEIQTVTNFKSLNHIYKKYDNKFKGIKTNKPKNAIKVGIVGELYSLMEPFSNYFIEKELAKKNMVITRFTTVTYLLFEKSKLTKTTLKEAGKYLKYPIGADGTESVARSRMLAELKYDGIIHIKPFGCTPEVNAMPMLQNISKDYKIPILYFSFDSQTSETGIKTRLEAFHDMIIMRRESRKCQNTI